MFVGLEMCIEYFPRCGRIPSTPISVGLVAPVLDQRRKSLVSKSSQKSADGGHGLREASTDPSGTVAASCAASLCGEPSLAAPPVRSSGETSRSQAGAASTMKAAAHAAQRVWVKEGYIPASL